MGTATEAILENDLLFSVYESKPPFTPTHDLTESRISSILYFARNALNQRNGSMGIINDSSSGDPASLGIVVILGNLTGAATGIPNVTFASAALDQVEYLLTTVPRAPNGAISHRVSEVQLWADFIYMCPPFLAYYGVVTNNESLVQEAHTQISLYRDILRRPSGLWQHIALGSNVVDDGSWSTGNAWAAAGIVRVLATIQNSHFSEKMKSQTQDLTNWASEIISAFYSYQDSTHLNHNFVDDNSTFLEASGSVLMASAVYRLAVLSKVVTKVPDAEQLRETVFSTVAGSNSSGSHIDDQGWLLPVVDPLDFASLGNKSPEGESFVLLLNAAYQDWVKSGSKGERGAASGRWRIRTRDDSGGVGMWMWLIVSGVVGIWTLMGFSL